MDRKLHIAMYPWFAMGHITPFVQLSNKLAALGHKISFFIPSKTQLKFNSLNLYPDLITFFPVTVPQVTGLPPGAETTYDVPHRLCNFLMTALDRTQGHIEECLEKLKPDLVFFDIASWVPSLASRLGIKSIHYSVLSSPFVAYTYISDNEHDFSQPLPNFPSSSTIKLCTCEALIMNLFKPLIARYVRCLKECDAIGFNACRELEGSYCDFIESQFKKPVLLSAPMVPKPSNTITLETRWANWLDNFKPGSVVYCAFGSEAILKKDQMQELLLGFELSGLPFFLAVKAPEGTQRIEDALPDGFEERVGGRGVVHGGWVQQQLILRHPSVGCFVTHCGTGSLLEALVNNVQMVVMPYGWDQFVNARFMSGDLKVAVEVEKRDEDGWISKEAVSNAILSVMDPDSAVAEGIRVNHDKYKKILTTEGFESSYFDSFVKKLEGLVV